MKNHTVAAEQTVNNRMYLFSAEMNLRTMNSMALTAYCVIFANGAYNVKFGRTHLIGDEISPFVLNTTIIISLSFLVIVVGLYLYAVFRAIVGKDGEKYYVPQITAPATYFKSVFILLILSCFVVLQTFQLISAPTMRGDLVILIFMLMVIACISGFVGLLKMIGLHRRYLREKTK